MISEQLDAVIARCDAALMKTYKSIIKEHKNALIGNKLGVLSSDQATAVQNLYLNPHLLLILDDCGAIFSV